MICRSTAVDEDGEEEGIVERDDKESAEGERRRRAGTRAAKTKPERQHTSRHKQIEGSYRQVRIAAHCGSLREYVRLPYPVPPQTRDPLLPAHILLTSQLRLASSFQVSHIPHLRRHQKGVRRNCADGPHIQGRNFECSLLQATWTQHPRTQRREVGCLGIAAKCAKLREKLVMAAWRVEGMAVVPRVPVFVAERKMWHLSPL